MAAEVETMRGMATRAARNRAHNQRVWRKLALFTVLMVGLPIGTFYGVRGLIHGRHHADMWSGFAAVLMVNIVIGFYILSAFLEKDDDKETPVPAVGRFATGAAAKKDQ